MSQTRVYTKSFYEYRYHEVKPGGEPGEDHVVKKSAPLDMQVREWVDETGSQILPPPSAPNTDTYWMNEERTLRCVIISMSVAYVPSHVFPSEEYHEQRPTPVFQQEDRTQADTERSGSPGSGHDAGIKGWGIPSQVQLTDEPAPAGTDTKAPGDVTGLILDNRTGTKCSVCGEDQHYTGSGPTCINGHGGAPPAPN
jgi:hypothetical protein